MKNMEQISLYPLYFLSKLYLDRTMLLKAYKKPLTIIVRGSMVAGAGLEPTTFGL